MIPKTRKGATTKKENKQKHEKHKIKPAPVTVSHKKLLSEARKGVVVCREKF